MKKFFYLAVVCCAMFFFLSEASGCRNAKKRSAGFWDTGYPRLDNLLFRMDSVFETWNTPPDSVRSAYTDVIDESRRHDDPRAKAADIYMQSLVYQHDSEGLPDEGVSRRAFSLDSLALTQIERDDAPYLYSRIEYDAALLSQDTAAATQTLYNLLPFFREVGDSMMVVDVLYELNEFYGEIWDSETQLEALKEIFRYIPAANDTLRVIMDFNIMAYERSRPDSSYIAGLEKKRHEKQLLIQSPPLGVIVYSDLYRLKGNDADLDTAGMYAKMLAHPHPCYGCYAAQRLRQAMKGHPCDSLDRYENHLRAGIASPSSNELETAPILADYLDWKGDKEGAAHVRAVHHDLVVSVRAYEKANAISRSREQDRIRAAIREAHKEIPRQHMWLWICIGLLSVAIIVGVMLALRYVRRNRMASAALKTELENVRRRLSVAQLQKIDQSGAADDWERFMAVFVEMHPDFPAHLKEAYPSLTRNDVRLCALLLMDMDTKHIARLAAINPESVKKHKQRLRAKFGLTPDVDWVSFLSRF